MALIIFGTVVVVAYLFLLGLVLSTRESLEDSDMGIIELRRSLANQNQCTALILKHLDLEYVPDKYKPEPAKLEKRKKQDFNAYNTAVFDYIARQVAIDYQEKPKKKRKYTKSGKYAKKK